MPDRPIIFSAPMVRALLAGRKMQTRRLVTPGTCEVLGSRVTAKSPAWTGLRMDEAVARKDGPLGTPRPHLDVPWEHPEDAAACLNGEARYRVDPIIQVGDRLWVKETWQTGSGFDGPQIAFRATGDCHDIEAWDGEDEGAGPSFNYERCPGAKWHTWLPDLLSGAEGIWRPSLFMPRWASRLTLLVTDVRVERLQDISHEDAAAEGLIVERAEASGILRRGDSDTHIPLTRTQWRGAPDLPLRGMERAAFRDLWEHINGPESWQANPWVVAVTFTVHARTIDQLAPIAEAAE